MSGSGFQNGIIFAENIDFSGAAVPSATITTNGQLLIGSTAVNGGGTHINVGNLVSPDASITIGYASPNITLQASGLGVTIVFPAGYPYNVLNHDTFIMVDTSAGRTIILPLAPSTGEVHTIKDNTGSGAANNITIQGNGNNIDGAATSTIDTNYGAAYLIYNGTQWNVV